MSTAKETALYYETKRIFFILSRIKLVCEIFLMAVYLLLDQWSVRYFIPRAVLIVLSSEVPWVTPLIGTKLPSVMSPQNFLMCYTVFQMRMCWPTLLGANVTEVLHITYSEWQYFYVFHPVLYFKHNYIFAEHNFSWYLFCLPNVK